MIRSLFRFLWRHAATIGISAFVGLFALAFWPPERTNRWLEPAFLPLHQLEWRGYDLLFHWRGPDTREIDPRIVIVGFDRDSELSLEKGAHGQPVPHPWPPPRRYHAQVLTRLAADGAKVVVFDILMTTPSGFGIADDRAMHAALAKAGCPVILACRINRDAAILRKSLEAPYSDPDRGIDFEARATIAFTEILRDRGDDVVRVALPLQKFQDEWLPSLSAAALLATRGGDVRRSRLTAQNIVIGNHEIARTGPTSPDPVDPDNEIATSYIDFPAGNLTFPIHRYEQVALGDFAPGTFKGKIVFVGVTGAEIAKASVTEAAKATGDLYRTAYSNLTPELSGGQVWREVFGVVIQAQMLNALLRRTTVQQISGIQLFTIVFLLALLAALGIRSYMNWRGPVFVLTVLAGYIGLSLWSFVSQRLYLPWLVPSMAMVVVVGLIAFSDRARLKQRWGRYVSPAYLEIMLREGFDAKPERTTATVLFGDIRGFTAFSERHSPEQVVELLDKHLDKLVRIVFEEGGTVDKFLGDGILVVFGAPRLAGQGRSPEEFAHRAVRAAWRMREASLEPVHDHAGNPFLFATGFGITTGPLVCGHVGGRNLTSLTLIGDTVNLASRLQAITGEADVVVDEMTWQLTTDYVSVEDLGIKQVKGKDEGVACFRLTALHR